MDRAQVAIRADEPGGVLRFIAVDVVPRPARSSITVLGKAGDFGGKIEEKSRDEGFLLYIACWLLEYFCR